MAAISVKQEPREYEEYYEKSSSKYRKGTVVTSTQEDSEIENGNKPSQGTNPKLTSLLFGHQQSADNPSSQSRNNLQKHIDSIEKRKETDHKAFNEIETGMVTKTERIDSNDEGSYIHKNSDIDPEANLSSNHHDNTHSGDQQVDEIEQLALQHSKYRHFVNIPDTETMSYLDSSASFESISLKTKIKPLKRTYNEANSSIEQQITSSRQDDQTTIFDTQPYVSPQRRHKHLSKLASILQEPVVKVPTQITETRNFTNICKQTHNPLLTDLQKKHKNLASLLSTPVQTNHSLDLELRATSLIRSHFDSKNTELHRNMDSKKLLAPLPMNKRRKKIPTETITRESQFDVPLESDTDEGYEKSRFDVPVDTFTAIEYKKSRLDIPVDTFTGMEYKKSRLDVPEESVTCMGNKNSRSSSPSTNINPETRPEGFRSRGNSMSKKISKTTSHGSKLDSAIMKLFKAKESNANINLTIGETSLQSPLRSPNLQITPSLSPNPQITVSNEINHGAENVVLQDETLNLGQHLSDKHTALKGKSSVLDVPFHCSLSLKQELDEQQADGPEISICTFDKNDQRNIQKEVLGTRASLITENSSYHDSTPDTKSSSCVDIGNSSSYNKDGSNDRGTIGNILSGNMPTKNDYSFPSSKSMRDHEISNLVYRTNSYRKDKLYNLEDMSSTGSEKRKNTKGKEIKDHEKRWQEQLQSMLGAHSNSQSMLGAHSNSQSILGAHSNSQSPVLLDTANHPLYSKQSQQKRDNPSTIIKGDNSSSIIKGMLEMHKDWISRNSTKQSAEVQGQRPRSGSLSTTHLKNVLNSPRVDDEHRSRSFSQSLSNRTDERNTSPINRNRANTHSPATSSSVIRSMLLNKLSQKKVTEKQDRVCAKNDNTSSVTYQAQMSRSNSPMLSSNSLQSTRIDSQMSRSNSPLLKSNIYPEDGMKSHRLKVESQLSRSNSPFLKSNIYPEEEIENQRMRSQSLSVHQQRRVSPKERERSYTNSVSSSSVIRSMLMHKSVPDSSSKQCVTTNVSVPQGCDISAYVSSLIDKSLQPEGQPISAYVSNLIDKSPRPDGEPISFASKSPGHLDIKKELICSDYAEYEKKSCKSELKSNADMEMNLQSRGGNVLEMLQSGGRNVLSGNIEQPSYQGSDETSQLKVGHDHSSFGSSIEIKISATKSGSNPKHSLLLQSMMETGSLDMNLCEGSHRKVETGVSDPLSTQLKSHVTDVERATASTLMAMTTQTHTGVAMTTPTHTHVISSQYSTDEDASSNVADHVANDDSSCVDTDYSSASSPYLKCLPQASVEKLSEPHVEPDGSVYVVPPLFTCKDCGKGFYHPGTLMVHERQHSIDKKEFKCDICNKVCSEQRYLTVHMKSHQRADARKLKQRKQHSVTDTGIESCMTKIEDESLHGPFICSICGASFDEKQSMQSHRDICDHSQCADTNDKDPVELVPDRHILYMCDLCGRSYCRKGDMLRHQKLVHTTDVSSVKCAICGCLCSTVLELFNHTVLNHKGKGLQPQLNKGQNKLDPNLSREGKGRSSQLDHRQNRLDLSLNSDSFSQNPNENRLDPNLNSHSASLNPNQNRLDPSLNRDSSSLNPNRLDHNLTSDSTSLGSKQEHLPELLQNYICFSRLDPSLDHDGISLDTEQDCSGRLEPDLSDDHGSTTIKSEPDHVS